MLYYLIKFFDLFKQTPRDVFAHIRSLYEEWSDDRRGQLVNEVLYMVPDGLQIGPSPHEILKLEWNQIVRVPGHIARIIWYLNNAKYSIDLAMYTMGSAEISKALIAVARRGVRVRIVTETNCTNLIESNSNIPVRQFPPKTYSLMHNKFCIIDGYLNLRQLLPQGAREPVTVCMTGSLNWVNYGESCDDVFITSAPRICKSLELEFYDIWHNTAQPKLPTYK
ncbi:hypothetical protein KR032_007114 [Drosophila birchii]|nr:hypothetical protein KR032_007114 [Drosophila birchii]